MKRVLAVLLVLCMAFTLFACGNNNNDNSNSNNDNNSQNNDNSNSGDSNNDTADTPQIDSSKTKPTDDLDKIADWDPTFDYSQMKRFKVTYVTIGNTVFNQDFNNAFEHWATKANVEYTGQTVTEDNDQTISVISSLSTQGYDGLLFDADITIYDRVAEVCADLDMDWMACMGQPTKFNDQNVPSGMVHPYVGFDMLDYGIQLADKLMEHAKNNWPDADLNSNVGFLCVDMAASYPLHQRVEGAMQEWIASGVDEADIYIADVEGNMTLDAAQTKSSAVISSHPEYTYWLCAAVLDDFAQGAAYAFDYAGLTDNAVIADVGGTALMTQWDDGEQNAWKYALNTPTSMYGEPLFFALYAFMADWATPESIWPSWRNNSEPSKTLYGVEYANFLLPSYWMEFDSYKTLLGWADVYADADVYGYPKDGISRDQYPSRMEVPDYYAG